MSANVHQKMKLKFQCFISLQINIYKVSNMENKLIHNVLEKHCKQSSAGVKKENLNTKSF